MKIPIKMTEDEMQNRGGGVECDNQIKSQVPQKS